MSAQNRGNSFANGNSNPSGGSNSGYGDSCGGTDCPTPGCQPGFRCTHWWHCA